MTTQATPTTTTDNVDPSLKTPRGGPGKGAKAKRNQDYRRKKNQETYAAILAGIFQRLKIKDLTSVPQVQLPSDNHSVTVPVTFKYVPHIVDRVWDTMEAVGTRPFAQWNTPQNKQIFQKGMLILCEAKLCYAQRAHIDKPDEDLPSKKLYNTEELNDLNNMAEGATITARHTH
ncbi:unnamed protein product [Acanthoscelides obtectus]|uniref:Uncharacterized protein n=1 Tax=Acanthoscelides obtectus TaxID=200917 RepID=A0A9P0NU24_ACAOB|nr:unnamed protein product [Acanthoscelides obtectus]CAK1665774.1 hypothetical protein AOBTE_LOCUS24960 [Acanthoscelides obtectus]